MRTPILLFVSLLFLAAAPPIVVRHDRDEAAFRALGARYEASLAHIRARDDRGIVEAEGTLVAPRWVLTAAHVARSLGPEATVTVGGRAYGIRSVSIHPDFRGRMHDLALVELDAEAAGGMPLPLYRGNDEAGREIIVLGRGMTGTGETGPAAEDGVLRGATNRIDEVAPEWVRFVFDAPGTAGVTDLEGISGPGDSGGPALLVEGGTAYVAGVSSGQDDAATGGQPGRYGVSEYYTRVSHYAAWIDRTMEAAPGEQVTGDLGRRLDAYLRAQIEASGFAGSVRVVKDGAVVLDRGYGLADRAQNLPNTAATVFDIGSIAKSFTAEAIFLLERQGRLALTDPVAKYIPDLPEDKRGITVQHLLDHAAGLHAYHDTEGDFEAMDRAEALRRIVAQDLHFEPGTAREYSNSGYTLLAALIENIAGQPFQAFVREQLVQPAGLAQTGFYGYPAWQSDQVAVGYGPRTLGPRNAPSEWPAPSWAILGAGGMGSTVGDLHRWMQRVMERRGERPPVGTLGGLLDGYETLQGATFVAIGGGDYGFVTATFGYPDGSAVLVASNAAGSGQENLPLLESLARMLAGGDPLTPAPRAVLARADLAEKPEGRTLLDLIDVIATGDEAARRRFIAERMDEGFQQDEANLLGFFGTVHETLGPAPVLGPALAPAPGEAVAYVQNAETGDWLEFTLSVEGRAPHRADGLGVRPQAPPETLGAAPAGTCEDDWGLPDSPRGRAASAFLSAVCTPDEAVHRAFIETHLAPALVEQAGVDRLLDALARMHRDFGGAADAAVQPAGEHRIQMDIRHDGHHFGVMLEIEPEPPHRISGIDVEAGGGSGGADLPPPGGTDGGGPLSEAEIARRLDAYVQALAADDLFSGAVLVARDGEVLFERAYGLADREAGTPNQLGTRFNMGSMNKMFTALAIAQLAEQGRLDFDDRIIDHVPDYPNRDVAERVTIHHLLTHTSGLGFYPFEHGAKTPEGILPFFADDPLAFAPGARMQYSNAGFAVLGLIVERVSGADYYDYVRRHILEPAGMTDTGSFAHDEAVPNRAVGYTRGGPGGAPGGGPDAPLRPNTGMLEIKGSPAGGGYSTVRDMWRFGEALKNHTLLGPEYTEILLTGKVEMGPGMQYAYGFGDHREGGFRRIGHNGGAPGVGADFRVYLDDGYTTVVFTNYDSPVAMRIAETMHNLIAR